MGAKTHVAAVLVGALIGGILAVKAGAVELPDPEELEELAEEVEDPVAESNAGP